MHIIHSDSASYARHIKGVHRGYIIARRGLLLLCLRSYGQLLLLQLNRELYATHLTVSKIQATHNIFAQLVGRFEETEASHESALVRNPIEFWSTPSGYILQVMERLIKWYSIVLFHSP